MDDEADDVRRVANGERDDGADLPSRTRPKP